MLNNSKNCLGNLYGFKHYTTVKLGEAKIEQQVFDLKKVNNNLYSFYEIVVFIHTTDPSGWSGVRCIKYATYGRPAEAITEIYNQNVGTGHETKVRFDKNTKIIYVTPYHNELYCSIYIEEFQNLKAIKA